MRLPGTTIEVDDLRPEDASLYIVTHYHADHRRGLRGGDPRPILCSPLTARLFERLHRVPPAGIRRIEPGQTLALDGDMTVQAFDANHCPGALMLLFEYGGRRVLHTGDFRYSPDHDAQPELFRDIDTLLLDCTFSGETREYEIPSQEEAIERVIELIREHPDKRAILGIYMIGKNRLIRRVAETFSTRVALPKKYFRMWQLLDMEDVITTDTGSTRIHAQPMGYLTRQFQQRNPRWHRHSIVILPTGWPDGFGDGEGWFYVPYSEHCSSAELRAFTAKVNAREVINTNDFFFS